MPTVIETLSSTVVTRQGGVLHRIRHASTSTATDMIFAIFLPSTHQPMQTPALYWLSGLTCTDENFCQKAGAFRSAEEYGISLVVPDTSPRGEGVANDDNYDLGQGAGFYINATQDPWKPHFQMETYILKELPALVEEHWGVGTQKKSVFGHSMGGHGALTLAFKSSSFTSVSAFAPICHPTACPWGKKAFENYLGSVEAGKAHDATELLRAGVYDDILIDEGTDDNFAREGQLLLADWEAKARSVGQKVTVRRQPGFGHSYYFMAAFVDDHIAFHAKRLFNKE